RDPAGGMVTTSSAVVQGLSLFGRVRIGELRSVATTTARGRPGMATATYDRELFDVWVDTGSGAPFTCDVCDPGAVLKQINRALTGTATATLGHPDGAFYPKGSPGGYQSVVRRNTAEAMAARSLNDDDATEVPGLELVVFADGRAGRTRQVLQFAAVAAEAHYGIYLLPGESTQPPPAFIAPPVPVIGPVVPPPAPSKPVHVRGKTETFTERVVKRVKAGFGIFAAAPHQAGLLIALWAFLLLPGYLVVRRRLVT
ncbi:MAG: hypothetical protein LC750_17805, partial [Actinobacteria bacterium]|nr:hypothetical protein [Actinomycetota bacterium]